LKSLLLVRHAKSSWTDTDLNDFDRPLNDRGKKDAPEMAKRLLSKKVKIDAFVSSPAKRAKRTAEAFAKAYDEKKDKIIFIEELYHAGEEGFYEVIKGLKDKYDNIAIFSHNPGITGFANSLTETRVDDMPTCSIFAIKLDTRKWADIKDCAKEFWFFDYPKADAD
jgi:phosphohistidine phosphatase